MSGDSRSQISRYSSSISFRRCEYGASDEFEPQCLCDATEVYEILGDPMYLCAEHYNEVTHERKN